MLKCTGILPIFQYRYPTDFPVPVSYRFSSTGILPIFHTFVAKTEAFITSWDELFYPLLIPLCAVCHQPSCHVCSHFAMVFKFATANILLQRWTTDDKSSVPDQGCMRDVPRFFMYENTPRKLIFVTTVVLLSPSSTSLRRLVA
jgi:hypothetical protein